MNKILAIAGRELHCYATTWLGYGVAFAALLMNGILFHAFALGDSPKFSSEVLRDFFHFASGIGMVTALLLSLRLIAEEKQNKSLVLLLSSPVSDREIIWGKFLAAFTLFLIIQLMSVYLPCLIFIEGKVSVAQIAVGYLGLCLLGASLLAIALFASAFAPTQLLAGLTAAALTTVLLLLWNLALRTEAPYRDILSYLSLHNDRFRPFTQGVLHLRDVVFYLSLVLFFTEAASKALEDRRMRG